MKHVIFHHEGNYFSFFEFLHQISSSIVFVIIFLEFATTIDTLLDSCSMENRNFFTSQENPADHSRLKKPESMKTRVSLNEEWGLLEWAKTVCMNPLLDFNYQFAFLRRVHIQATQALTVR